MEKNQIERLSKVYTPAGTKLVTCRNLRREFDDPIKPLGEKIVAVKSELRHLGKCQQVTILDYIGDEYLQQESNPEGKKGERCRKIRRIVFTNLHHGPNIGEVDLRGFDRRSGSVIRITPKFLVRFAKVTVKVTDLMGNILAHDLAVDLCKNQEWSFSFFPVRRIDPDADNLMIVIKASVKPRPPRELTPEEIIYMPGGQMAAMAYN